MEFLILVLVLRECSVCNTWPAWKWACNGHRIPSNVLPVVVRNMASEDFKASSTSSTGPYLHESRHLHALRRGRFLISKKDENQHDDVSSPDKSQCNINLNSDKNELTSSDRTS
ncbi:hypothetical protein RJT34_03487 [Clitoria ternatea]|uniref:Uncharacterized protein n=1 Tax=Clitoria ternatea TaxID=43366 RepID=A0AAN9KJI6_CLITE